MHKQQMGNAFQWRLNINQVSPEEGPKKHTSSSSCTGREVVPCKFYLKLPLAKQGRKYRQGLQMFPLDGYPQEHNTQTLGISSRWLDAAPLKSMELVLLTLHGTGSSSKRAKPTSYVPSSSSLRILTAWLVQGSQLLFRSEKIMPFRATAPPSCPYTPPIHTELCITGIEEI